MNTLEVIIFGIVEGITEFLPISSTAHLDLTRVLLNIPLSDFIKNFEITIQLGAILAIVYLYREKLFTSSIYFKKILISFMPTAIIGFVLYKFIKEYLFGNTLLMLITLFSGGILILVFEYFYKIKESKESFEDLNNKDLILLGIAQAFAVIPGISRSLAVILSGRMQGINKKIITEFSFLLAIPTMLAATLYDLYKNGFTFEKGEWIDLSLGFIVSFFVALIVVKWLLNYIKNNSFAIFGWYRIFISIILALILI